MCTTQDFLLSVSFAVNNAYIAHGMYMALLQCLYAYKTEQKYMSLQLTEMLTDEGNSHTHHSTVDRTCTVTYEIVPLTLRSAMQFAN